MEKITAAITGVQGYVPDYILDNNELAKMVDTTDEWITSRTGIKERRIMKNGASSDMACKIESIERDRIKIKEVLIPISETYKKSFFELINS